MACVPPFLNTGNEISIIIPIGIDVAAAVALMGGRT